MPPGRASKRALLAAAAILVGLQAAGGDIAAQPAARAGVQADDAWLYAPLTPGRWTYTAGASSQATYGGQFAIRCIAPGRILLQRPGVAAGTSLTFRNSTLARTLTARVANGGLAVELPAGDALLDALAFSRGRFALEAQGAARLIVPAWPELGRVIEDCRR